MIGPRTAALIIDFLALLLLMAEQDESEGEGSHTPT